MKEYAGITANAWGRLLCSYCNFYLKSELRNRSQSFVLHGYDGQPSIRVPILSKYACHIRVITKYWLIKDNKHTCVIYIYIRSNL